MPRRHRELVWLVGVLAVVAVGVGWMGHRTATPSESAQPRLNELLPKLRQALVLQRDKPFTIRVKGDGVLKVSYCFGTEYVREAISCTNRFAAMCTTAGTSTG